MELKQREQTKQRWLFYEEIHLKKHEQLPGHGGREKRFLTTSTTHKEPHLSRESHRWVLRARTATWHHTAAAREHNWAAWRETDRRHARFNSAVRSSDLWTVLLVVNKYEYLSDVIKYVELKRRKRALIVPISKTLYWNWALDPNDQPLIRSINY